MKWWNQRATSLQQAVRIAEIDAGETYSEDTARVATVHTREDMVCVVSLLASLNEQVSSLLWTARILLVVMLVLTWAVMTQARLL